MEHGLDHFQAEQEEEDIFPFAFSIHPSDGFEKQTEAPNAPSLYDHISISRPPVGIVTPPKSVMQGTLNTSTLCYDLPFGSSDGSSYLPNTLPDLTASVVSNRSLNSTSSELDEDDSLFHPAPSTTSGINSVSSSMILSDSLHLESAASLLMQDSRNWAAAAESSSASGPVPPGFSQLLDQADDQMEQQATSKTPVATGRATRRRTLNKSSPRRMLRGAMARLASVTTSLQQQQLPAVREESDSVVPSSDDSMSSRSSAAGGRDGESVVILSEGEEYIQTLAQPQPLYQNFPRLVSAASTAYAQRSQQEHSLAALAGVTVVTAGRDTFVVSVRLSPNAAEGISSVLDVLGNPELLPLWCGGLDEFQHLVIVRRSEDRDVDPNRAYEGEWVEATAPLVVPPTTGFVVRWTTALKSALGGTNYGQISLFAERLVGRVSLSLGPFPGNVHVCHRLQVSGDENASNRILIKDTVHLKHGDDDDARIGDYCGLLDHCFLPTVQDYTHQAVVSLARLRFLLEQGEQSLYASAAMTLGQVASMPLGPNETDSHMTSPLLVG